MRFRFSVSVVAVLFLLLISTTLTFAQTVLLNEDFENQFPANGWSVRGYTPLGNDWIKYNSGYHNGLYSATVFPNVNNASSWLFSSPIQLSAGNIYVLKYYVNLQSAATLTVSLKEAQDYNSNSTLLHS